MTPDYRLIETHAELLEFCNHLERIQTLYVDTEFVGEKNYWPLLEMVQVYDGKKRLGLIDTAAIKDLEPLGKVLGDETKLKVLHSPGQDIPIMHRVFQISPRPVFDTQLAAAMVGIGAQVSFASLVSMFCHVDLPKSHTVSDWSRRPLSKAQLDYAADDVFYLPTIHEKLQQRLDQLERTNWLTEEQDVRFEDAMKAFDFDEENAYRTVKEWGKLSGVHLAALQGLALWRENAAREQDKPRRMVIGDLGLISLARSLPKNSNDARNLRQVPQGPLHRYMDEILDTIKQAIAMPKSQWPRKPINRKPDMPAGFVELLQALIRTIGEQEKISPTILATSSDLQDIVANRHKLEGHTNNLLTGWRRELAGEKVLAFLDGNLRLRVDDRESLRFY